MFTINVVEMHCDGSYLTTLSAFRPSFKRKLFLGKIGLIWQSKFLELSINSK